MYTASGIKCGVLYVNEYGTLLSIYDPRTEIIGIDNVGFFGNYKNK